MHLVVGESDIKHGFKSCHESTVHSVLAYTITSIFQVYN